MGANQKIPLLFTHRDPLRVKPVYSGSGGSLHIELQTGDVLQVETFYEPGKPPGLRVRGLNCALSIEPDTNNLIVIAPRRR